MIDNPNDWEHTGSNVINPLTDKQRLLIINMIKYLDLDFDREKIEYMTKDEASSFIQKYAKRYEHYKELWAILREIHGSPRSSSTRRSRGRKRHVDCNPFAGPHDCDYMDCYDFGIAPWGDS